jgi:3'(2'), 5'-bisphosphate nucleotidase
LDGTKEFLQRNGEFTVNIGLCQRGAPLAGVVYCPALDPPVMYKGVIGDGLPIKV